MGDVLEKGEGPDRDDGPAPLKQRVSEQAAAPTVGELAVDLRSVLSVTHGYSGVDPISGSGPAGGGRSGPGGLLTQ